jgi:fucose permease
MIVVTPSPAREGATDALLHAASARKALAGFFLSGLLSALLPAILPAWGYHSNFEFIVIGNYYLYFIIGILISARAASALLPKRGVAFVLTLASVMACAALMFLAFASPPTAESWRLAGVVVVGMAVGLLNVAVFHAISPIYQHDPASTVNMAGIFFGLGCLLMALLVAGTFYIYSVTNILLLTATIPSAFFGLYAKASFPSQAVAGQPTVRESLLDFKSMGAVLLALLLFFQFGNEWSIAGWLPIFLIHQLGLSPEWALILLGVYWISLLAGRVAAMSILPRVGHGKLLLTSALAACFGCVVLLMTDNRFGASMGIVFAGCGFAPIYPLVAEKIGHRFHYYQPGIFSGVFSFAMIGGMLAPAILGYIAQSWGVGVIMGLPLLGTCMVSALILLIWLESKIGG